MSLLLCIAATAQSHTKFLGIGMDEPLVRFGVYLEQCGFVSKGSSVNELGMKIHTFSGRMYGQDSTTVSFMLNGQTEAIIAIFVDMPYSEDGTAVQECYKQVFNSLCEQYGDDPNKALILDTKRQADFPFENVVGRFCDGNVISRIERADNGAERAYGIQIIFQDPINAREANQSPS